MWEQERLSFFLRMVNFILFEMNTRIQVEHGITEAVTGIDLVREQILIASGEELGISQDDVLLSGHAINAGLTLRIPNLLSLLLEKSPIGMLRVDLELEWISRLCKLYSSS